MKDETKKLYKQAMEIKYKLIQGLISVNEAHKQLKEYAKVHDEAAIRIGKEYKMKPKLFNPITFLR